MCPRLLFPLIVSSNSSSSNRHRRRRCKWDYADPALQTALYSSHPRPVPPWDELTIDRIDTVAAAGGHVCWKGVFRPRPRRLYLPRKIAFVPSALLPFLLLSPRTLTAVKPFFHYEIVTRGWPEVTLARPAIAGVSLCEIFAFILSFTSRRFRDTHATPRLPSR